MIRELIIGVIACWAGMALMALLQLGRKGDDDDER